MYKAFKINIKIIQIKWPAYYYQIIKNHWMIVKTKIECEQQIQNWNWFIEPNFITLNWPTEF